MQLQSIKFSVLFIFTFLFFSACLAQNKSNAVEWPCYGNDPGGKRFATSTQINLENIKDLQLAWTYRTGELEKYPNDHIRERAAFEATPIMVNGIMYFSTPSNRVIALDAKIGKMIWEYDPKVYLRREYSEFTSRGVSIWEDKLLNKEDPNFRCIFMGTVDGRLIALNAKTGKPMPLFGEKGIVDLKLGVGRIQVTSPPVVVGDIVITGSAMADNNTIHEPRGVVRAFDARSGKLIWSWDPIPRFPEDKGYDTWENQSALISGSANAWAPLSVDREREMVFIPTSCPAGDFYGGERAGDNLFANSVVALNAKTGKYIWHYQVVHHDIWDYDIAAQPVLFDLKKGDKKIPAVLVGTKMGHVFILDRMTGKPLFPVEERAVPQKCIAGEQVSKTQVFPVLPLPLGLRQIEKGSGWGPNEAERKIANEKIEALQFEGIFTPPSIQGTIVAPSNIGGIHWGGMSVDVQENIMVTNINKIANIITLLPKHDSQKVDDFYDTKEADDNEHNPSFNRMTGTPYFLARETLIKLKDGELWPQTTPPWGTLVGIDLETGKLLWEKPLGYMMDPEKYPDAKKWGSANLGGSITTAGGLTYVAASLDGHLRAFNTKNGNLLWEYKLPANAQATPMSYEIDGKQYIAICAGGHGKFSPNAMGDYVMVFALK